MTPEQLALFAKADESLEAARLLLREGFAGYAAARAYYAMFYVAEAALLSKGMAFSRHSAVHGAFGVEFVKTGLVARELHRSLVEGMEIRQGGDYGAIDEVSDDEGASQVGKAVDFVSALRSLLASTPRAD